jgi:hypothetical protein
MEHIIANNSGDWVCICGNQPSSNGFYPCTDAGQQVDPTPQAWNGRVYVCDRCSRIIDQRTLNVVGRRTADPLAIQ